MRILVTGSRGWDDETTLLHAVTAAVTGRAGPHVVVHGACPTGGDALAERVARDLGLAVERHPADWHRYGREAGYRRNAAMVALGADLCLAFIADCSPAASMTARLAEEAGIPVRRYRADSTAPVPAVTVGEGSGP